MNIVAAGALTAGAAVPPLLPRRMRFLSLHFQPERVKILACLPSVWVRAQTASLLVSSLSLLRASIFVWFCLKTV